MKNLSYQITGISREPHIFNFPFTPFTKGDHFVGSNEMVRNGFTTVATSFTTNSTTKNWLQGHFFRFLCL